MNFKLFYIISSIFYNNYIRANEDYRVVGYRGNKLPLYTGLYYGVVNAWSGYIHSNLLIGVNRYANYPPPIDPQNVTHWIKLRRNANNARQYHCVYSDGNSFDGRISKIWNRNYYDISFGCAGSSAILVSQYYNNRSECYTPGFFRPLFQDRRLWKFIEMPDYKLHAIMSDFRYELPLWDVLRLHFKKFDILHTSTITNDSNGTVTEKLGTEVTRSQFFELSFANSITRSLRNIHRFSVKAALGFKLFEMYDTNLDTAAEFGWDMGIDGTNTIGSIAHVAKEIVYDIDKELTVPPFSKVQVRSYANWIEKLVMKYKANITVTGIAPVFERDSRLDSQTIKVLLSKYGFAERLVEETPTSLTFETTGIFKGTFGLDSVFTATLIGSTRNITTTTSTTTTTATGPLINYNQSILDAQSLAINTSYIIPDTIHFYRNRYDNVSYRNSIIIFSHSYLILLKFYFDC